MKSQPNELGCIGLALKTFGQVVSVRINNRALLTCGALKRERLKGDSSDCLENEQVLEIVVQCLLKKYKIV